MSLEKIHLRKLLQIFDADPAQRKSLLRADIRSEIAKKAGPGEDGGDFHVAFWADAKRHAAGELDLREQAKLRVAASKNRFRLYPMLADGFLIWWDEKRRWRNEPLNVIPQGVSDRYDASGLGQIKIENLLAVDAEGSFRRIIYPYFSERPILTAESARLGLWVMSQCFKGYSLDEMRILDVLRGASFASVDYPFIGNEEALFLSQYEAVLGQWHELWKEY